MANKWVYKSNWDFKLNIKPSVRKVIPDNYGNEQIMREKAKFVKFVGGFLVCDETMAQQIGLPLETLVSWVEASPDFNKRFWLVESPEKAASKSDVEAMEKSQGAPGPQVIQGVRKSGTRTSK